MKPISKTIVRLVIFAAFMGAAFAAGYRLAPDDSGDINVGIIFGVIASAAMGFCLLFLAETRAAFKRDRAGTLAGFKMLGLQLGCIMAAPALLVVVSSIGAALGFGETFRNIALTAFFSGFVGLFVCLIMAEVFKDIKPFKLLKAAKLTARCAAIGLAAGLCVAMLASFMGWSYTGTIAFCIGIVAGCAGSVYSIPQQVFNNMGAKGRTDDV